MKKNNYLFISIILDIFNIMNKDLLFITFGYIGSCMIGVMFIPQVLKTIKTNKTDDLSIIFLAMNTIAVLSMIPYSVHFKLTPILIANTSVGICNGILLYYTINNSINKKEIKEENTELKIIVVD
jgi:MtN3 and saliva related transmembrane protein